MNLVGLERAGVQVLLARPALEGVARTAVDLAGFDPGDGSVELPPSLDLPGLLQFGGLQGGRCVVGTRSPLDSEAREIVGEALAPEGL